MLLSSKIIFIFSLILFVLYIERFNVGMLRSTIDTVRNKMLTHAGSIELQSQLEEDPIILPSIILHEIEDNLVLVCLDTYGNYVCQKVIPYLSSGQLYKFVCGIAAEFELMATSIPGSCIISVLMNHSVNLDDPSCKIILLQTIERHVAQMICDPQGSHLLQLALVLYDQSEVEFILQTVKDNFFIISNDRFGCCLIKKIIEIDRTSESKIVDYNEIFSHVYTNLITLSSVRTAL